MTIREMLATIGDNYEQMGVQEFSAYSGMPIASIRSLHHRFTHQTNPKHKISNIRTYQTHGRRTKPALSIIPSEWKGILEQYYQNKDQDVDLLLPEPKSIEDIQKREEDVVMMTDFNVLAGEVNHCTGDVKVNTQDMEAFIQMPISDILAALKRFGVDHKIIKETSRPEDHSAKIGFIKMKNGGNHSHATTAEL